MSWEVQITGEAADLQMLAEVFIESDLCIKQSRDEWVLTAAELDALSDAASVRNKARE